MAAVTDADRPQRRRADAERRDHRRVHRRTAAPSTPSSRTPAGTVPWPPQAGPARARRALPAGRDRPATRTAGLREERYYLRLLVAMVLVIVVGGFVIGIIGLLLGFAGRPATVRRPTVAGRRAAAATVGRGPAGDWDRAHAELVDHLRTLIRIPSVNPPPEPGDGELAGRPRRGRPARRRRASRPRSSSRLPGRGSVTARLRGDGTGGDPLLLLSHLDVVPAPRGALDPRPVRRRRRRRLRVGPRRGRHEGDGRDGGRRSIRRLAAEARAAGRDPATDPIPGLTPRRPVRVRPRTRRPAGSHGAGWIVDHRPELLQAVGALNECGGVSVAFGGRRFYPIGVAEKGYVNYRIIVHGTLGSRLDAAAGQRRGPGGRDRRPAGRARPDPAHPGDGPLLRRRSPTSSAARPATLVRRIASPDPVESEAAIAAVCDEMYGRAVRALLRDTASPNVIHAGVKYNVIPGSRRDRGRLPDAARHRRGGHARRAPAPDRRRAAGRTARSRRSSRRRPSRRRSSTELYRILESTIRDHDPDGVPGPGHGRRSRRMPSTRSGSTSRPTASRRSGSSPDERFLERFHGVDERVGLDALRFGLPVLYDVGPPLLRLSDPAAVRVVRAWQPIVRRSDSGRFRARCHGAPPSNDQVIRG